MKTFTIAVTQEIEVTLDETKFTPEFMADFRKHFYPFQTVEDHAKLFARMYAVGSIPFFNVEDHVLEGYGALSDYGVSITEGAEIESEITEEAIRA